DDQPALYLQEIDGGESRFVAGAGDGLVSIEDWDAARGRILVRADRIGRADDAPVIIESMPWKLDGTGLLAGRRVALAEIDTGHGCCTWLVDEGGDVREARWSPDRTQLAWLQDATGRQRQRNELWVRDSDGGTRRVATGLFSIRSIAWAPEGGAIAVAGNADEGASQSFLHIVDLDSGDARCLDDIEASSPGCIHWMDDGIALVRARHGGQQVVLVAPDTGATTALLEPGEGQVMGFAIGAASLGAIIADAFSGPDFWLTARNGSNARKCGDRNAWRRARRGASCTQRQFEVPDGMGGCESIDGWLLAPAGDGPFPLLLDM